MRRGLGILAFALVPACGGGPPAPSTVPLPFSGVVALGTGRRALTIVGDSLKCGDLQNPQAGTAVNVDVMGSSDSGGWTLRPLGAEGGSFEIRIERALGTGMFGAVALTGSARGYAVDSSTELSHIPAGTTLTFAPSGTTAIRLTGQMPFGSLATGEFQETITFSRGGATAACPAGAAMWSLTNSSQQ